MCWMAYSPRAQTRRVPATWGSAHAQSKRIMERLGAQSLPELVQIAVKAGLQAKPPER